MTVEHNKNDVDEKSSIDILNKALYSKKNGDIIGERKIRLQSERYDTPKEWGNEGSIEESLGEKLLASKKEEKVNMNFFNKLLVFSIVFFTISIVIVFLMSYKGTNIVSSRNVDITVTGPVSIGGGEKLALRINIKNNNTVGIRSGYLNIVYPEGTRPVDPVPTQNSQKEVTRFGQAVEDIPAGGDLVKEVNVVLFGEEGSKKEILVTFDYKTEGSNAVFSKDSNFEINIGSSSFSILIDSLKEIVSGQDTVLKIEIVSNSDKEVDNLLFSTDYPSGFVFKDADPKPDYYNNVWNIGNLKPKEKKVFIINGSVSGPNKEERIFKFYSGRKNENDEKSIGVVFASASRSILIKESFVSLDLLLNNNISPIYISRNRENIKGVIKWSNNLPYKIKDMEIKVKLNGDLLNKESVDVIDGFYQSNNNTIIWDKNENRSLGEVLPKTNGRVSFSFSLKSLLDMSSLDRKSPEILIEVSVKGRRLSEKDVPEEVFSIISKKVVVSSNLSLTSKMLYSIGPFVNSGLIPPKVGNETTYTVVWTISNTLNDLSSTKVTARLPSYVTWVNRKYPENEDITFNSNTNEISWNLDKIKAGTGSRFTSREVAFQVSFLPSTSQIDTSPVIIDNIVAEGRDDSTGVSLEDTSPPLTIYLNNDPGFRPGGVVIK